MKPPFKSIVLLIVMSTILVQCNFAQTTKTNSKKIISTTMQTDNPHYNPLDTTKVDLDDKELKQILPAQVFDVARNKGTEYAFSGQYYKHTDIGTYHCIVCGNALFKSDGKFASSCGWPSFFEPISDSAIHYYEDNKFGMKRIETTCGRCESHLGHIFDDGPAPTYKRYCINSVVLQFEKKATDEKK